MMVDNSVNIQKLFIPLSLVNGQIINIDFLDITAIVDNPEGKSARVYMNGTEYQFEVKATYKDIVKLASEKLKPFTNTYRKEDM